jgi:hypothetical protein
VVLTYLFWACFLVPGHALSLGYFPGLARLGGPGRMFGWPVGAGVLSRVAYGYAGSLLLASPWSLLCYATDAPLWCFSAALCALAGLGTLGLLRARLRFRAPWRGPRLEAWLPYLGLVALLWLQGRVGGWLDGLTGDVTVYVGRMRVLLEHGFTNRDIYLSEYRFGHVYHHNLLLALYASAAQLTGQAELTTWFHTEVWAKLCVAAGHAVLGERLTGKRSVGLLLALCTLTLTAAETYALYPNALSVRYLLPMLLGLGFAPSAEQSGRMQWLPAPSAWLAALTWLLAQVHVAYAVYGLIVLGPWFGLWALAGLLRPWARPARLSAWLALSCLLTASPFVLLSMYGARDSHALSYAPEQLVPLAAAPARVRAGVASISGPRTNRAADALGGHLETALEPLPDNRLVFAPERIGGWPFVWTGFACFALAVALYARRRVPLLAAGLAALWIACILFASPLTTRASELLQGAYVVARLSTLLCSLLMAAACAVAAWPIELLRRGRKLALDALSLVMCLGAAALPAHAPESFRAHVARARAPRALRHSQLEQLSVRRDLLREHVPAGRTVLATAYFARQVVMLCDCYVLAADRGHTHVLGIQERRRDLEVLNAASTPWPARAQLLRFYGIDIVTFERRRRQRYAWAYEHGRLLGSAGGLDIVRVALPPLEAAGGEGTTSSQ